MHLHCIVTGGGLALDGRRWVRPVSPRYLVDVVALSARYRAALLTGIEEQYEGGNGS